MDGFVPSGNHGSAFFADRGLLVAPAVIVAVDSVDRDDSSETRDGCCFHRISLRLSVAAVSFSVSQDEDPGSWRK